MRARKSEEEEEEENGALDLLDDRHSGDPINITLDANTEPACGTSLQGQLPSVQRRADTVAVVFAVKLNLPLSRSRGNPPPENYRASDNCRLISALCHNSLTMNARQSKRGCRTSRYSHANDSPPKNGTAFACECSL